MNKILEVSNLKKYYHTKDSETLALNNISFSVNKGEFISIVGPSGCGKSTILSILSGILTSSGGTVIKTDDTSIAYMLQHDCLFPFKNVMDNCCLGLNIKKDFSKESKKYVNDLLKKYGLEKFKNSYPNNLSGGMRQRVALIRTLAVKPDILLLDEATSALDYQSTLSISEDIYKIVKDVKITVIMVTHDIPLAISMSDRVIVLSKRPATIKSIHKIDFGNDLSPIKRRKSKEFINYYTKIWGELNE